MPENLRNNYLRLESSSNIAFTCVPSKDGAEDGKSAVTSEHPSPTSDDGDIS